MGQHPASRLQDSRPREQAQGVGQCCSSAVGLPDFQGDYGGGNSLTTHCCLEMPSSVSIFRLSEDKGGWCITEVFDDEELGTAHITCCPYCGGELAAETE